MGPMAPPFNGEKMLTRKSSRIFALAVAGLRSASGSDFLVAVLDKAVNKLKSLESLQEDLIGHVKFLDHRISELYREGFKAEELEDLTRSIEDIDHTILVTRDRIRALEFLLKDPYSSPPGEYVELGLIQASEIASLKEALSSDNSFILRGLVWLSLNVLAPLLSTPRLAWNLGLLPSGPMLQYVWSPLVPRKPLPFLGSTIHRGTCYPTPPS